MKISVIIELEGDIGTASDSQEQKEIHASQIARLMLGGAPQYAEIKSAALWVDGEQPVSLV